MLKKLLIYGLIFVMSAGVTFGIVVMSGKIAHNIRLEEVAKEDQKLQQQQPEDEEEQQPTESVSQQAFLKMLMNLTSAGSFEIYADENFYGYRLNFSLKAKLNIDNFANSKIVFTYFDKVQLNYYDSKAFLKYNNMKVCAQTETIKELISLFGYAFQGSQSDDNKSNFNLGIFEQEEFLKIGELKENANSKILTVELFLSKLFGGSVQDFKLDFYMDSDYNVIQIKAKGIKIDGFTFNPTIHLKTNVDVNAELGEKESEYADLKVLPSIVDATNKTLALNKLKFEGNIKILSKNIDLKFAVNADFERGFVGKLNFDGFDGNLYYKENKVFASVLGKNFYADQKVAQDLISVMQQIYPNQMSKISADEIKIMSEIQQMFSQMTTNNIFEIVEQLLGEVEGFRFEEKLDKVATIVTLKNGAILQFVIDNNGIISSIDAQFEIKEGQTIFISVGISQLEQPIDVPTFNNSIDLSFAPALIKAVAAFQNVKAFEFNGNVSVNNVCAKINKLTVDLNDKNNIKALINFALSGAMEYNGIFAYQNNIVIAENLFGKKGYMTQKTLKEIVSIATGSNGQMQMPVISADDISKLLSAQNIFSILQKLENIIFVEGQAQSEIVFMLESGQIKLLIENGEFKTVSCNLNANGTVIKADVNIETKNLNLCEIQLTDEYIDFAFVPKLYKAFGEISTTKKLHLDGKISVSGTTLKGLEANISNFKIDLSSGFEAMAVSGMVALNGDINLEQSGLVYRDGNIYVNLQGFYLKLNRTAQQKLLSMFAPQYAGIFDVIKGQTVEGLFSNGAMQMSSFGDLSLLNDIIISTSQTQEGGFVLNLAMKNNMIGGTGDSVVEIQLVFNHMNRLVKIVGTGFVSALDGNTVDFDINVNDYGNFVEVDNIEQGRKYIDFSDSLPLLIEALQNTAKLESFDLSANVDVKKNGQKYVNTSPQMKIKTSPTGEFGIEKLSGSTDLTDLGLGVVKLWYDEQFIVADVNGLKVKLNNNSRDEIFRAVVSTLFGENSLSLAEIIDMIASMDFKALASIIDSIQTTSLEDGTVIVKAVLRASELYGDTLASNIDVEISVKDGYLTNLKVLNVISVLGDQVNFSISLNNIGVPVNVESVDHSSYIDISPIAPVITAFGNTAKLDYFHITGAIDVPFITGIQPAKNHKIDVQVKVAPDGTPTVKFISDYDVDCWKNKISHTSHSHQHILWYENGMVYVEYNEFEYRFDWFGSNCYKVKKYKKMTLNEFMSDPIKNIAIGLFGFTLADKIPMGGEVNLFGALDSMHYDGANKKVSTVINPSRMLGTSLLGDTFKLDIFMSDRTVNGKTDSYLTNFQINDLKVAKIANIGAKLQLIDIGKTVDSVMDLNRAEFAKI